MSTGRFCGKAVECAFVSGSKKLLRQMPLFLRVSDKRYEEGRMARLWNYIQNKMNDFNVKKKLMIVYVCCVLLPLLATDSVILTILLQGESREQNLLMKNISSAVQFDLSYTLEEAVNMTKSIYVNSTVNDFLNKEYESGLDYYAANQELLKLVFSESSWGTGSTGMVLFTDNETIVNGGHFYRLSSVKEEEWYRKLKDSGQDMILHFYYVGDYNPSASSKRRISLVRKLNYFKNSGRDKLVRIDLDYNSLVRKITNMKYGMAVYVCIGDKILLTNNGRSSYTQNFERLTGKERIGYETQWNLYGENIRILVMRPTNTITRQIWNHFPLILFMLAMNIALPWLLTYIINNSFTSRLRELSRAFDEVEAESLKEIKDIKGKDEIGSLMRNYNRMVRRSQELIKAVYKDRLARQEMDISRQNAELLALHSQINPHFLFNVLESIRMHSILKNEEETAGMIEQLAVLERQNVNWTSDLVSVKEEIKFIEAYLNLQKYRFGERISYEIVIEPGCESYSLPKLTLVTFVENACVHGIENKAAPCWIYVRAFEKEGWLYLEVEDTGEGMDEEQVRALEEKMSSCTIETIKENEHVGISNACLRLKMVTAGKAQFKLESEKGIGTCMLIKVPVNVLPLGWKAYGMQRE